MTGFDRLRANVTRAYPVEKSVETVHNGMNNPIQINFYTTHYSLQIHNILRFSLQEATYILDNTVQKTLTAFLGSPGDMRCDDAVGCAQ